MSNDDYGGMASFDWKTARYEAAEKELKRVTDALEQQAAKENRLAEIICDQAAQIEALRLTNAGLIDSLRDEMDEGLRLRELGGALPDENITAMTERIIGERAAQAAALAEKDAEIARLISTKEHIRKEINAMIGRVEDDAVLIEALRAECDAYKRDFDAELAGNGEMRKRFGALPTDTMFSFLDRLEAEFIKLRADAERLDYLQSKRLPAYTVWTVTRHWKTDGTNDMEERSTFDGWACTTQAEPMPTIREAIDAALRQEQPT